MTSETDKLHTANYKPYEVYMGWQVWRTGAYCGLYTATKGEEKLPLKTGTRKEIRGLIKRIEYRRRSPDDQR